MRFIALVSPKQAIIINGNSIRFMPMTVIDPKTKLKSYVGIYSTDDKTIIKGLNEHSACKVDAEFEETNNKKQKAK